MRTRNALIVSLVFFGLATPLHAVRITERAATPLVYGIAADRNNNLWYTAGNKFDHFSLDSPVSESSSIAANILKEIAIGPDGNLWGTDPSQNKIWRYGQNGNLVTSYDPPTAGSQPTGITLGPDGNIWFTEFAGNKIGRITNDGAITEFPLMTPNSQPNAITVGPDGDLWFTEFNGNNIGHINAQGLLFGEYPIPSAGAYPEGLAANGTYVAVTETGTNKIALFKIVGLGGTFATEFPIPTGNAAPQQIVLGADGAFWFTEYVANKIGRLENGTITEYPIPTPGSHPYGLASARTGDLWFAETAAGKVGRVELRTPGDVNDDGNVDVLDVFYTINFLFAGGAAPK
jgi:virginiamycin B lyase